jgi:hypothetical protein
MTALPGMPYMVLLDYCPRPPFLVRIERKLSCRSQRTFLRRRRSTQWMRWSPCRLGPQHRMCR